ncbi:MAG: TIGR04168 family protein [Cyanobacteria bacterium J06592_8]
MKQDSKQTIKIAIVGDVHDQWEVEDEIALKQLGVDLVLFVGDYGNEAVEIVKAIAALDLPKAAVFGNHDAWYTMTEWGRKHRPYDPEVENRVQQQIDLFGEAHVGYGKRDFPQFGLTVVGSRPFTWGGPKWRDGGFYQEWFGVNSFEDSTRRIVEAAKSSTEDTVIFLGHTGPQGLGEAPEDPCGRDWKPIGGDYGDPDLAEAIAQTHAMGKKIPLVTFGHMHHNLRHTKTRRRKSIEVSSEGTVYLNAARVHRIEDRGTGKRRNFSIATLEKGHISEAELVWIDQDFQIAETEILYRQSQLVTEVASVL